MTDTLFADVSEFQVPVDDTYPYPILSIRSNDGTYRDGNFATNYRWMCDALDAGTLTAGIVYFYWRSNWADCVSTMQSMVGTPHPKMVAMLDVESGGNPGGDQSGGINSAYWALADWLGNPLRVIGYANKSDFNSLWRTRPDGLRMIGAGYGSDPQLPGQIAHQFTDGVYSRPWKAKLHNHTSEGLRRSLNRAGLASLPLGCSPFGNCDMNAADGLSADDFAAACGVGDNEMTPAQAQLLQDVWDQLRGPDGNGWPQLGGLSLVDALAEVRDQLGGPNHNFGGWPQLGNRTVVDAVAELLTIVEPSK